MKKHTITVLLLSVTVSACAPQTQRTDIARVCDSSGCWNRPAHHAANVSSTANTFDEQQARIAALEAIARQNPRAAYDLGLRYFRGDGVRQDSYQALQWMRDAAERGDLNAQKAVGRFYLTGLEEMGADYLEAEKWLHIAASRGDKEAAQLLAEASHFAAHQRISDDAYHRWINRWQPVFYRGWYSGYPYQGRWHNGYWHY